MLEANIIHYYFRVLPAPWHNYFGEILKCSKTNCFAEGPPTWHSAWVKLINYTPLICKKFLEIISKGYLSSELFWGRLRTQTSKNSSATIINHQGQANRKYLAWIILGGKLVPHRIQIKSNYCKPPLPSSHHTKTTKHIKQLKCHNFVGTTLPKGQKSGLEQFIWGGWVPMRPWNANSRTQLTQRTWAQLISSTDYNWLKFSIPNHF